MVSNWTKTPPTEPGAYWFRNKELSKFLCDYDSDEIEILKTSTIKGEWCGPLVPADEVEKAWHEGFLEGDLSDRPILTCWNNSRAKQVVEGKL